jgi:hypothetical protein
MQVLKAIRKTMSVLLASVLATFMMHAADGAASLAYGSLRGVALAADGRPVASVSVVIRSADGATDRRVESDSDGVFAVESLKPGPYQITASRKGMPGPAVTWVEVAGHETAHPSVVFGIANPTPAPPSASPINIEQELMALKERITVLEAALKARDAVASPPTVALVTPVAPIAARLPVATAAAPPAAISAAPPAVSDSPAAASATAATSESPVASPAPPVAVSPPSLPVSDSPAPETSADAAPGQIPSFGTLPQTPAAAPKVDKVTPFADADWSWLNGSPRNTQTAFDTPFFTPEFRADVVYTYDFNRPQDNSIGGSSEIFRSNEIQVEQLGVGGDFHWDNVRGRLMTQFGMYSQTTPRNDPSPGKGQWTLADAYRYISEASGGYHLNVLHGINIDAGIFMSYVGLFSYYNFDNWAYQPSYVSSNTPWFFEGLRVQIFPTNHLKIEPWVINGWQSYGSANSRKGLGGQIKWTPFPWMNVISNNYGLGHDDLFTPNRARIHTDNSIEIKYFDRPSKKLSKMAFTFTGDLGCEFGGGVSCHGNTAGGPKQSFIGFMFYNRWWFDRDLFAFTLGGGAINNPGRYLVLLPPINGMTAPSAAINSPYFTENPGDPFKAWDVSGTFDYMPRQWLTFRFEGNFRHANVPYWSGPGGITPPPGSNNGFPTEFACMNGAPSPTIAGCAGNGGLWLPDLRRREILINVALLVKF